MDREYARPLDVPALARMALMSPAHFSRQFRAAYGETPYGYLMTRRIERAMALLRRGDLTVTEVCMEVGCTSLGSFSSRFTEIVGESPAPTARAVTRRARSSRRASPSPGRGRAGTEKRAAPAPRSVPVMDLTLSHSFITVDDQDKALTFYRDALGFEVRTDAPLMEFRWLTVGPPSQPGVEIVLATPDMGHGPDDEQALRTLMAKGALNAGHIRDRRLRRRV